MEEGNMVWDRETKQDYATFGSLMVLAAICMVLAVMSGCGGVLRNLDRTNELTASLTKSVRPLMKAKAKDAQDTCFAEAKKAGKPKPESMEECPAHERIWDIRRAYYKIANGIHLAVRVGAIAYELGDEKDAARIATKVALELMKLKDLVSKAGYLGSLGL